jgi:hypothetical protein
LCYAPGLKINSRRLPVQHLFPGTDNDESNGTGNQPYCHIYHQRSTWYEISPAFHQMM